MNIIARSIYSPCICIKSIHSLSKTLVKIDSDTYIQASQMCIIIVLTAEYDNQLSSRQFCCNKLFEFYQQQQSIDMRTVCVCV